MSALTQLRSWPVPNAAAAVIGRTGVLATEGDVARTFALASLTKPLAAMATLVAVEEGALALDDAVPALAAILPGSTLRQLLAHASGIAPERRQRAAAPGTRRIYSNAGYDVVGEWATAATGIDFAEYLSEAIGKPLGLADTRLDGSPAKDAVSTVADLTLVVRELLAPSGLLHSSTLQEATSVQLPGLRGVLPGYGSQEANDWGLGFEIRGHKRPHWTAPANSPATYGHFGRRGTMFWVDPAVGLGLIALSDRDFDEWAVSAWPALSQAVLDEFS